LENIKQNKTALTKIKTVGTNIADKAIFFHPLTSYAMADLSPVIFLVRNTNKARARLKIAFYKMCFTLCGECRL